MNKDYTVRTGITEPDSAWENLQKKLFELRALSHVTRGEISSIEEAWKHWQRNEGIRKAEPELISLELKLYKIVLSIDSIMGFNYKDDFIWTIDHVAEKKQATAPFVESEPFYSRPGGYKMRLRLYFNGDGLGKGTHLSLFFSIMKGEYDENLFWPFQKKVTLMLLDRWEDDNIVKELTPNTTAACFWQPRRETNAAVGFPKFAPLSVLNECKYVEDDTIYFKVHVDNTSVDVPVAI